MSFGEKILDYKEEILKDLANLIAIDSVSAEGKERPQKALHYILRRAEEMGLSTANIDDIAGHVEYGEGEKLCGVLTHLDVVPAGDGWTYDPFTLTKANGRLYGRGVADDKGSAVITLYCLKVLKDSGIISDKRIRAIFGTNEEIGMTDMQHYFSGEPLPDIGFTPDSDYGICCCEKGILQFSLTGSNTDSIIKYAYGGNAVNAVPDKTVFTVNGKEIVFYGEASHAMEPHKGKNAFTIGLKDLSQQFDEKEFSGLFCFILKYISDQTDGKSLGIKQADSRSGELTLNVGVIQADETSATVKIDIRYPVSADCEKIIQTIKAKAEEYHLTFTLDNHSAPLNISENSEIVHILSRSYRTITNADPVIYSTGGGTYARTLQNRGVAFGPVFPDDYSNMHRPDESLNEEKYFLHAQICLEAMYEMFTA